MIRSTIKLYSTAATLQKYFGHLGNCILLYEQGQRAVMLHNLI